MVKDKIQEVKKEKLSVKVVVYGDYLTEARELLAKGPVEGMNDVWNVAVSLLHSRNEVIRGVVKGGEQRFVVKA